MFRKIKKRIAAGAVTGAAAVVAVFTSLILLVTSVPTVIAEEVKGDPGDFKIELSIPQVEQEVKGKAQKFSIDVMISDVPATGLAWFQFAVAWDSDHISFGDVDEAVIPGPSLLTGAEEVEQQLFNDVGRGDDFLPLFLPGYDSANKCINIKWATGLTPDYSEFYVKDDGVLVTLNGELDNVAPCGEYDFKIVGVNGKDDRGRPIKELRFGLFGSTDKDSTDSIEYAPACDKDGTPLGGNFVNGTLEFVEKALTTTAPPTTGTGTGTPGTGGTGGTTAGGSGGGGTDVTDPPGDNKLRMKDMPTPTLGGDVNCDDQINTADISTLLTLWKISGIVFIDDYQEYVDRNFKVKVEAKQSISNANVEQQEPENPESVVEINVSDVVSLLGMVFA